jgi:hypothetical protein
LEADITKANADAAENKAAAEEHTAKADTAEKERANAIAIRTKENADFTATHDDFAGAINAIERAKNTLNSRSADVKQSLAQVRTSIRRSKVMAVAPKAVSEIDALLALPADNPQANAYEFQSGSVVTMLEKMRLKFQDQKLDLEKAEMNNKANHEVLAQKLHDTIKESRLIASEKTAVKAQRMEDSATATGEHEMTSKAKAEDEKALDDMNSQCHARSEEFEKNQVVRADEVRAIEKASEVLRSEDVSAKIVSKSDSAYSSDSIYWAQKSRLSQYAQRSRL